MRCDHDRRVTTQRRDLKVLGVAAVVVVAAVTAGVVVLRGTLQEGLGPVGAAREEPATLEEAAQELNASLPAMVDEQTRLDEAEALGREFHYRYTLLGGTPVHGDRAALASRLTPHLTRTVCGNAQMRDFLYPDVTAVYTYRDEAGSVLTSIRVSLDDCAPAQ